MIEKLRHGLLLVLTVAIAYGYHPMFFNEMGEPIGGMNRMILLLTGGIFMTLIPSCSSLVRSKSFRTYAILLGIISFEVYLFYALGWHIDFSEIRILSIPLILIAIGYTGCKNREIILWVGLLYIAVIVYAALQQILQNIGSFIIADQYDTSAKNSLGPMLTVAGTISLLLSFRKGRWIFRAAMLLVAFIILIELLTIRARLATVAYVVVTIFVFYKYIRSLSNKTNFVLLLLGISVLIGIVGSYYIDWLLEFANASFMQNKEDDLLSGRGAGYSHALDIISDNPYVGNLVLHRNIPWVHNYILLKLSGFGIIGSMVWLTLYGYLGFLVVRGSLSSDIFKYENFGYVLMLIPFFVSLGEPTYPYGPGTANFIPFLMLGATLRFNKK